LLCKNITVAKSREVKTGLDVTESSTEGYGSEAAVLPVMMKKNTNYEALHYAAGIA
jgi:hypothetical protein